MPKHYDVIVIGGGPGGSTAAHYCARHGLDTLLLEKAEFPRDKVCGDAFSGRTMSFVRDLGLDGVLERSPSFKARGFAFAAPNGRFVRVRFGDASPEQKGYGYVCRRLVFDDILFAAARRAVSRTIEGFRVEEALRDGQRVIGVAGRHRDGRRLAFHARAVVGADGAASVVARALGTKGGDRQHLAVATRCYYRGIKDLSDLIEIHFVDEVMPGYFWIFPLGEGMANVGFGTLYSKLARGPNLRQRHLAALASRGLKARFQNAEAIGAIRGWQLPLGSQRRPVHSNGALLIGDAAGLVDPSSGEGIGNAMLSGNLAAKVLARACAEDDCSAASLEEYPRQLWELLGDELRRSTWLQRFGRFRPLLNLAVALAERGWKTTERIFFGRRRRRR